MRAAAEAVATAVVVGRAVAEAVLTAAGWRRVWRQHRRR